MAESSGRIRVERVPNGPFLRLRAVDHIIFSSVRGPERGGVCDLQ
jgi:hypothetical protein